MRRHHVIVSAVAVMLTSAMYVGATSFANSGQPSVLATSVGVSDDIPESVPTGARVRLSEIRSKLAIIRRAPSPSDELSEKIAKAPFLSDGAAEVKNARRVRGTAQAWVAPSSNGEDLCVIGPGELGCPGADLLAEDGLSVGFYKHGDTPWRVTGVAIDGISSVTAHFADGTSITATVANNYFAVESPTPPVEVRWQGPNGAEVVSGPAQ